MASRGAIPALILFILGVLLALPNEANIGVMILESIDNSLCDDNKVNVACQQMGFYIFLIKLIGSVIILADIIYIIVQIKEWKLI